MADNASVFEGKAPDKEPVTPTKVADGSIVEVLVGEGRKYASIEALAKSRIEADDFIETLKSENATLREANARAKTVEDVLKRMETKEVSPPDKAVARNAPTEDEIANIVKNTMTGMETARTRENNLKKADDEMKRLFGEKAQEAFLAKAATPELKKALTELASVSPAEFVALFTKGSVVASSTVAASGGVNTAALGNQPVQSTGDPTTKAYYDEVRKKDTKRYYSRDFQLQMHDAAQANPNKFFGRTT